MKTRFTTYDIVCSVAELQKLIGMRVNQVYDIDHRTYLIRLQRSEEKQVLLIESGNRIHTTSFEWPKNVAPSGFSMKMRKHLKNKRLESLSQVGTDRIIDLQFGSGNAAYHVILEAYDRGNIVLTDCEWTILNILRPHTQEDQIRFAVREKYPLSRAHTSIMPPIEEILQEITNSKPGESLKKVLNPLLSFGPSVIEHILLIHGISVGAKIGKDFNVVEDSAKLIAALHDGSKMMESAKQSTSSGYIIQKKELKPSAEAEEDFIYTNLHFHPFLFEQYKDLPYKEFPSFDLAVDEYFSTMEGQKLDLKALQLEREALKKLENVKRDRDQRLQLLESTQDLDRDKAELITRNKELVDDCITAVQNAVANRVPWSLIEKLLKEAGSTGDPIGVAVKELKLEINHISLLLHDPCYSPCIQSMVVDIDLAHTAFGNARIYYNQRRSAANKHRKTIESQDKALKSAEKKTKQTLKELQAIHKINKLRKTYWFEKFYWFISSENYLVIGGRDKQQNELIVKRYFKPGDAYVHADLIGASSVVVKNPSGAPIPSKTLAEAGTMAIAYSTAWEAKIVPAAWWVHHDQVSKTAPTGQYLKTGSFMIRGKKNFLQPCQLIMGLGYLFCLEEGSIERHKDERKVRVLDEEFEATESVIEEDKEIKIEDDSDDDEQIEMKVELQPIEEERNNETTLEENIECSKSSSEDDGENPEFPDTQIKIDISGPKIMLHVDSKQSTTTAEQNDENAVVHLRDDKSVRNTSNKEKSSKARCRDRSKGQTSEAEVEGKKEEQKVIRRGQKSKLKKMKEKYKDQDEEDRRLSMQILQSAGAAKQNKRKNKNRDPSGPKQQGRKKGSQQRYECSIYDVDADWHPGCVVDEGTPVPPSIQPPVQHQDDVEPTDIVEDEDTGPGPEVDMLDQLTGKPMAEDELLFAVPVIAPYNTLLNYKFKVKLTPGTGKRGKAARTALEVFLKDKMITSREKDLLKAVREDITARNIPGKVKISAPQIQKLRKGV